MENVDILGVHPLTLGGFVSVDQDTIALKLLQHKTFTILVANENGSYDFKNSFLKPCIL